MPGPSPLEKTGLGELEVCSDKSPGATWSLERAAGGFVSLCNEDVPGAGRSLQRRSQRSLGLLCRGGRVCTHIFAVRPSSDRAQRITAAGLGDLGCDGMEDGNQVGGLFGITFGLAPNSVLYS